HALAPGVPAHPRVRRVDGVTGADEDGVWTAPQCLGAAHRRMDPEPAGHVVRGRDDAASMRIAADDKRLRAQRWILELLHGGEEGVEGEVRDDHRITVRTGPDLL